MDERDQPRELTQEIVDDDLKRWAIVRALNTSTRETAVFRIRTERPGYADTSDFSTAISILWRFQSKSGFPPQSEKRRMDDFEDAIEELAWFNGYAELFFVATGDGVREWLFYTRDRARFLNELNRALEPLPKLPLEIEYYDDPNAEAWKEVLQRAEPADMDEEP